MDFWDKQITVSSGLGSKESIADPGDFTIIANDEFYVENQSWPLKYYLVIAGALLLLASLFLSSRSHAILKFSIASIPALICTAYGFIAPEKINTYDRLNNKIILSKPLFAKSITFLFSKGQAVKAYYTINEGMIESHLAFRDSSQGANKVAILSEHNLEEYWSFTVWYMDKNRPLPPGTAFDPYRQKDFERRKAEGFPKPLYPSTIDTPEATPEQQAERRRIGGW